MTEEFAAALLLLKHTHGNRITRWLRLICYGRPVHAVHILSLSP